MPSYASDRHDIGVLERVVDKALGAWRLYGHECSVERHNVLYRGGAKHVNAVPVLTIEASRRVEVILDNSVDRTIWSWLAAFPCRETWQLCALVPLNRLGEAHNWLCDADFEVQGWWMHNGSISFGRVEIA